MSLAEATHSELTGIKGIGSMKASTLLASMELGKRLFTISPEEPVVIRSPQEPDFRSSTSGSLVFIGPVEVVELVEVMEV